MQLLHRMFGSPRQSFLSFLFPIGLMLLVMATMHSCGKSGEFHKVVDDKKESEPPPAEAKAGETGSGSASESEEEEGKLVLIRHLELFP